MVPATAAVAKERGGIAIIAIYIAQERERELTITLGVVV